MTKPIKTHKKKKPAAGRPSLVDEIVEKPDFVDRIKTLGAVCLTMDQIALSLGLGRATLYRLFDKYPKYYEITLKARQDACNAIATRLFKDATEAGNFQQQRFWLKNQAGWKDSPEIEINFGVNFNQLPTVDQAKKILAADPANEEIGIIDIEPL